MRERRVSTKVGIQYTASRTLKDLTLNHLPNHESLLVTDLQLFLPSGLLEAAGSSENAVSDVASDAVGVNSLGDRMF